MKTIIFSMTIVLLAVVSYGQVNEPQNYSDEIVVNQPEFYGTDNYSAIIIGNKVESLDSYFTRNVQFPAPGETRSFPEGTELIGFEVSADGTLENITVINSVTPAIDDEMIRVLKSTAGMWVPGSVNGEPVAMQKQVSLAFKVSTTEQQALNRSFAKIAKDYFLKGSKQYFEKKNLKKALANLNKGVNYLPTEPNLLLMRSVCLYEMGDYEAAQQDWERVQNSIANKNSSLEHENLVSKLKETKGYSELLEASENRVEK